MAKRKHGNTIAHKVPKGMLTRSQLAQAVGVSVDTIKRWRQLEILVPTTTIQAGKVTVYLYNQNDVEVGKALKRGSGRLDQRL